MSTKPQRKYKAHRITCKSTYSRHTVAHPFFVGSKVAQFHAFCCGVGNTVTISYHGSLVCIFSWASMLPMAMRVKVSGGFRRVLVVCSDQLLTILWSVAMTPISSGGKGRGHFPTQYLHALPLNITQVWVHVYWLIYQQVSFDHLTWFSNLCVPALLGYF